MDDLAVIDATRRWIFAVVIGLNLCPFARRTFLTEKIRYAVSHAGDAAGLLRDLATELETLASCPASAVEGTLLIHPRSLPDFLDYNDFLGAADQLVERLGLAGAVQLASFHPAYQFAGTQPDAVENYTNRSPYPMLHLLREESITAVSSDRAELLAIPPRNVETLRRLGREKVLALLEAAQAGALESSVDGGRSPESGWGSFGQPERE